MSSYQPDGKIKAFIFDLDGVITDTAELHFRAWERLTQEEGIPFSRTINEHLRGISRRDSLERILHELPPGIPGPDEVTKKSWLVRKNDYYRELLHGLTADDVLPGVMRFLNEARALNIKIGLGSVSHNACDVLTILDLLTHFDAIGVGGSVSRSKPAPDLFVWVAGKLGVSPSSAVVFEDSPAGVDAAITGGFYAVGIGMANVYRAHFVTPSLGEISPKELIDQLEAVRTNLGQ